MAPVALTQLEVPDYDLGIRGKLLRSTKLAKAGRTAFCSIVYGLDSLDEVTDLPLSSAANGYPDAFAVPDESTRVRLGWRRDTEAVIADLVDERDELIEESPRAVLRRVLADYQPSGVVPVLGFEYECYLLHADDDPQRRGPVTAVRTLDQAQTCYSVGRMARWGDLFGEFMDRMDSVGVPVEACHSELGPGFFEYAVAPLGALAAADAAVRSRQYLRDLCAERGLVATFMAKLRIDTSGSGGHLHQSLTRKGVNLFADGADRTDGLSPTGRHYLGGLLVTMGELTALFNPFLNSYKRLNAGMFVAERASWGWDNRNAACRVIHNGGPAATRIEHRRPGADANPYLVAAAVLAGGLHGLTEQLDPGDPLAVGADLAACGATIPAGLAEATIALRGSAFARKAFGDRFVTAYAATRDAEVAAFERWWRGTVTDWELTRHLTHL